MFLVYFIGFAIISAGIIIMLGIDMKQIEDDISKLIHKKGTLKSDVDRWNGKKSPLRRQLILLEESMESVNKKGQFVLMILVSITLGALGVVVSIWIQNPFLIPFFVVVSAILPFAYGSSMVNSYNKAVRMELETTLSMITTTYLRTGDIQSAVGENLDNIKAPLRDIFGKFYVEITTVTSDTRSAIRHLQNSIDNAVFREWCDTLLRCQDDKGLIPAMEPILKKYTDMRIVNSELDNFIYEPRREFMMIVAIVILNIPLLYIINRDWFNTLMFSLPGKIVLGVIGVVTIVTSMLMIRYTKPIEYKK